MKFGEIERPPTTGLIEKCWKFSSLWFKLTLTKLGTHSFILEMDGVKKIWEECIPEHDKKCIKNNQKLEVGKRSWTITTVKHIKDSEPKETKEEDCDDCDDDKTPSAELLALNDCAKNIGEFLTATCTPRSPFKKLEITIDRICVLKEKKGCRRLFKKCDKKDAIWYGLGTFPMPEEKKEEYGDLKDKGFDIEIDTVTNLLIKIGGIVSDYCKSWEDGKDCIYNDDGSVKEGKEKKLTECWDKVFGSIRKGDIFSIISGTSPQELIADKIKDLLDCVCKE